MKFFLHFLRFGLCIDRYLAERSGNHAFRVDSIQRIAAIDRELDLLEVQHGR